MGYKNKPGPLNFKEKIICNFLMLYSISYVTKALYLSLHHIVIQFYVLNISLANGFSEIPVR